jgi:hypothetical protein
MITQAVETVVQVGAEETLCLRQGTGPVVLLVTTSDDERHRLLPLLAGVRRVIAPVPPVSVTAGLADGGGGRGAAEWLRGVLDGLGVWPPALVVSPAFAATAVVLAAADPGALVVVLGGEDGGLVAALGAMDG